jgi:hypothetical protein
MITSTKQIIYIEIQLWNFKEIHSTAKPVYNGTAMDRFFPLKAGSFPHRYLTFGFWRT